MTNAISAGTRNLTYNIPAEEHRQIVKLSNALRQSMGELMKRITMKGLEAELVQVEATLNRQIGFISRKEEVILRQRAEAIRQTIQSIRSAREKYYGAVMSILFLLYRFIPE